MTGSFSPDQIIAILSVASATIIAVAGFGFNYWQRKADREFEAKQKKAERDFQCRQQAGTYYMRLYGKISYLDELADKYGESLRSEFQKAKFFHKSGEYKVANSEEILNEYKECYESYVNFYITKISEGLEIFIDDKLKKDLIDFWARAQIFYDDPEEMKKKDSIEEFHKASTNVTKTLEELFGLRQ